MRITLTNDFHNTAVILVTHKRHVAFCPHCNAPQSEYGASQCACCGYDYWREARAAAEAEYRLSETQRRKAKNALCGIAECTCSGPFGTRGPQDVDIEPQYSDGRLDGGIVIWDRTAEAR
jgi:hypothetical protein